MNIFGKELHMAFTIGAMDKMAEMCPDGDITKLAQALDGYKNIGRLAKMVAILSEQYELRKQAETGEEPNPVTEKEVMLLMPNEITELETELFNQIGVDATAKVETKATKKAVAPKE